MNHTYCVCVLGVCWGRSGGWQWTDLLGRVEDGREENSRCVCVRSRVFLGVGGWAAVGHREVRHSHLIVGK